jgi:hypothetical protein
VFYPRSPVRADHDNVNSFLPRELEDFLIFPTGFGDDIDFRLILDLAEILIGISLLKIFPNGRLYLKRCIVLIGNVGNNVEDIEKAAIPLRNAEGIIEGAIRIFGKICTEEHSFVFRILNHS